MVGTRVTYGVSPDGDLSSWAVSGRILRSSLGRVSGPWAFSVDARWHAIV